MAERDPLPPMPPGWMPATEEEVAALREEVDSQVMPVVLDLAALARLGALGGVAEVIAERRRQLEHQDEALGRPSLPYAAEAELDFGNYARAAALLAAELDRLNRNP